MSLEEILGRASWPDSPSAPSPAPRPLRRRRGVLLAAAVLGLVVVVAGIAYRLHARGRVQRWGAPKWPPKPPNARHAPAKPWRSSVTRA